MVFDKVNAAFSDWRHLSVQWRRLQDVLFAIWAIIAWDTVANLAALAALTGIGNGGSRYVRTLRATFTYDSGSVLVPDGITVIANPDGGNWIREEQTVTYWCGQAAWYVNPATGNDENTGSVGAPIQTLSEFGRRVQNGTLQQTTTVNVASTALPTDVLDLVVNLKGPSRLQFVGTLTQELEALVTGWSKDTGPVGPNNNDIGTLSLAGWTVADHLGQLVYFVDGPAADGYAWITDDLLLGNARVSSVLVSTVFGGSVIVAPVVGNTARVYSLPIVNISSLWINGDDALGENGLMFQHLRVRPAPVPAPSFRFTVMRSTSGYCLRSNFDFVATHSLQTLFANCAGCMASFAGTNMQGGAYSEIDIYSGTVLADSDPVIDSAFPSPLTFIPGISMPGAGASLIVFGLLATYGDAWGPYISPGNFFQISDRLIGISTGFGLVVNPGATALLDHDDVNTLVSPLGNVWFPLDPVATQVFTWAQVPYQNPHTGARVLSHHTPGQNYFGGAASEVSVGIKGNLTAAVGPGNVSFALQDLTENGTEVPKIAYQNAILSNLYAHLETPPGAAGDIVTIAVLVNGVATLLTCFMNGATQNANDTNETHRVIIVPGDRVSVRVTAIDAGGATFTAADLSVSLEMA